MTCSPEVFARPVPGADPCAGRLALSLTVLLSCIDPGRRHYEQRSGAAHRTFQVLATAVDLALGCDFVADEVAAVLCDHIDGRQALVERHDCPASACRKIWMMHGGDVASYNGQNFIIDGLARVPACPEDILDALPADAASGVALARRLPPHGLHWQLALAMLESCDMSPVPDVGTVVATAADLAERKL